MLRICDDFVISIYVVVGVSILIAKRWRVRCFFSFDSFRLKRSFLHANMTMNICYKKKYLCTITYTTNWLGSTRLDEWEPNAKENVYYEIKTNLNWFCFYLKRTYSSTLLFSFKWYSRFRQPERSKAFVLFTWFVLCFRFFIVSFKTIVFISCKLYIKYHSIGISRV